MCRPARGFAMLGGAIRNRFKNDSELCLNFVGDSMMNSASSRMLIRVIVSVASLTAMTATAVAQEMAVLEEIVVTAQKREQSLQDVPIAVSVITGDLVRDYLGSGENLRASRRWRNVPARPARRRRPCRAGGVPPAAARGSSRSHRGRLPARTSASRSAPGASSPP